MAFELEERVVSIARPSRKMRRAANGTLCDVCPNRVHFSDSVAVIYPSRTAFAHAECVALIAEEIAKHEAAEDVE